MAECKLTISRSLTNKGEEWIDVCVEDENYKTIFKGNMEPKEFARAITGLASRPIKREV